MIALVFPGQGSQYLGMGKDFYERSYKIRNLFEKAEDLTHLPLKRLIFEGPLEDLTLTENLQPSLTLVNISILDSFKDLFKEIFFQRISFVAGHSLGEFSALYAGSVLSFEDTIRAVQKRGEVMGKVGSEKSSGMYAIINFPKENLKAILSETKDLVIISNFNSPKQLIISGEEPSLTYVAERAKAQGAKVVKLKVSAGFHSPLMAEAEKEFALFIENLSFKDPQIPFVSNVSAQAETSGERIRELLKQQITSPVRWIEVVEFIYNQGVQTFVEIGPKKILKGLISQILEGKPFKCYNIEKWEDLEHLYKILI